MAFSRILLVKPSGRRELGFLFDSIPIGFARAVCLQICRGKPFQSFSGIPASLYAALKKALTCFTLKGNILMGFGRLAMLCIARATSKQRRTPLHLEIDN